MTDLKILLWPDPRLKQRSNVVRMPGLWDKLAGTMTELMLAAGGVGLSAIQVGCPYRLVVSKFAPAMYNPFISGFDISKKRVTEGCLSLPGFYEEVYRHESIQLTCQDLDFKIREQTFTGLAAQCFQHELEHLEGHFFTDHLPSAVRSRIRGEVQKLKRAGKYGK